jgi:hypothetical protein
MKLMVDIWFGVGGVGEKIVEEEIEGGPEMS